MKKINSIHFIGIAGILAFPFVMVACNPPPTYSLVMTCDGPFMRRTKEAVMKRDSDGKLYYKNYDGRLSAIAEGAKLKDICR